MEPEDEIVRFTAKIDGKKIVSVQCMNRSNTAIRFDYNGTVRKPGTLITMAHAKKMYNRLLEKSQKNTSLELYTVYNKTDAIETTETSETPKQKQQNFEDRMLNVLKAGQRVVI